MCVSILINVNLAVDCGPLAVPMNGSLSGDSTVFPNSVFFNCDAGFILNESSKRTCQADGTWSGSRTVCVGRFEAIIAKTTIQLIFQYADLSRNG